MIHTIVIDAETELEPLKKLFRKKLMTGGAVFRLASELTDAELETIYSRFSSPQTQHDVSSMVLEELAGYKNTPEALLEKLSALKISPVNRALEKRN